MYAGISFGIPDLIAACLAGFCPVPPVRTCPSIISFTSFFFIPDLFKTFSITHAPRSSAGTFFRVLPIDATAVLTAEVI